MVKKAGIKQQAALRGGFFFFTPLTPPDSCPMLRGMGTHSLSQRQRERDQIELGMLTIDEDGKWRRVKRIRRTPCRECEAPVERLGNRMSGYALCGEHHPHRKPLPSGGS